MIGANQRSRVSGLSFIHGLHIEPTETFTDRRDGEDNSDWELALAAGTDVIAASKDDPLAMHPWREVANLLAAPYTEPSPVARSQCQIS